MNEQLKEACERAEEKYHNAYRKFLQDPHDDNLPKQVDFSIAELSPLFAEMEREIQELKVFRDGAIKLKELHATERGMELHIEQTPELAQCVAKSFASLIADAPNYVEMQFKPSPTKWKDKFEWVTVTVVRGTGKTAHQLWFPHWLDAAPLVGSFTCSGTTPYDHPTRKSEG